MRKILAAAALTLTLIIALTSCQPSPAERHACALMDEAEKLIETQPTDALQLLDSIDAKAITSKENAARHALLLSMALDKNYIDTTSLAVIQPAADYYLQHGTPKQRLRTYYYQGRIYQNRNDEENAMFAFINAAKADLAITDTLTYARTLVAQGVLFLSRGQVDEFIQNNIQAANLYHKLRRFSQEAGSLARAMNGSLMLKDKALADSIRSVFGQLEQVYPAAQDHLNPYTVQYATCFGTTEDIRNTLDSIPSELSADMTLDVAHAQAMLGDFDSAKAYIDKIDVNIDDVSEIRYWFIMSDILYGYGDYRGAFNAVKQCSEITDSIHENIFTKDLEFAKDRHEQEISTLRKLDKQHTIIWIIFCSAIVLILIVICLIYRYNIALSRRNLAEAERDNLNLRIMQLEHESDSLRELLNNKDTLPCGIKDAIQERVEMLNALLASEISENSTYAKSYGEWLERVLQDKQKFMDTTRLAFKASHPHFIEYLEKHNLTDAELNYVCLYAIGLRGKEVGEFLQLKRHYHISSDIRKKLGIDEHETNIGIYIRRLMKTL